MSRHRGRKHKRTISGGASKLLARGWKMVDCVQQRRRHRRGLREFVKATAADWRADGYRVRTRAMPVRQERGQTKVYCTFVKKR